MSFWKRREKPIDKALQAEDAGRVQKKRRTVKRSIIPFCAGVASRN